VIKLETKNGDGHAIQASTRVLACYPTMMFFSSHYSDLAFINVLSLRFESCCYFSFNLQKVHQLHDIVNKIRSFSCYLYRDLHLYIYTAKYSFCNSKKKKAYTTTMQPTALFVFVALALLQVAFVRGKLLNFDNQKDVER
jgi:hypothetical protein